MSTSKPDGRLTAIPKKDRSRLCAFTFADGRQCRSLRRPGHPSLCYEHAEKQAAALIAKQAGEDLVSLFCGHPPSPFDSAAALGRVLSAVAGGYIKPKTAVSLALLGHTLNQSIELAQHEYANTPGRNPRPERAPSCLMLPAPPPEPTSQVAPAPQPEHSAAPEPNPQSTATRSAPSTKSFRINICAERPIITPVTTFRITTSRSVDSKAT